NVLPSSPAATLQVVASASSQTGHGGTLPQVGVFGAAQRIEIIVALAVLALASATTAAPQHGAVQPRPNAISQGPAAAATDGASQRLPGWTGPEIASIQKQLSRLGLYRLTASGNLDARTQSGLVEAFGSEEWRTMDATTCLGKLTAAQPSAPGGARPGQHELRL